MIQVNKEPDSILVFSVHRLNCLLEQLEEANLGLTKAPQKINTQLHTILSHLFNLTHTDYFINYLQTKELTLKTDRLIGQLKISLKQLIGFAQVLEQKNIDREAILSEILQPVKASLLDLLLCIQQ